MDRLSHSSDDLPLLNLRQLKSFVVLGHENFVELMEDLANDIPTSISAIRMAMLASDIEESSAAAHSSRGILSYFGCIALNKRLEEIEALSAVDPSQADNICNELTVLWDDSVVAINEWARGIPEFNP